MQIYLMQHGLALSEAEDSERPLSEEGKAQIETSAQAIQKMGLKFDVIVTSTKKRSKQTAETVARVVGIASGDIVETELLKPSAAPEAAIEYLDRFADEGSVFVAGHLPSLTKIASLLLTQDIGLSIQFGNGGLCRIDVERPAARNSVFWWYVTAEQLKMMTR